MSTHASIQRPGAGRGRYVHFDGYPSGVGEQLWAIVKRDGVEKARQVLVDEHGEWRCLHTSTIDTDGAVEGYGEFYPETEANDPAAWWDDMEWNYVLEDEGLRIVGTGLLPWSDPEPDWRLLDRRGN